jgi:hypothetical protein
MMMMMMMMYTENEEPVEYTQRVKTSAEFFYTFNSFVSEFILPQCPILSICIHESVKIFYLCGSRDQ